MSARLTMFLRTLAIGCCVVAFTAVAQTDPQQRPDGQHDSGQQRPADQHAGHTGQQPQTRQQPGQQTRPQPQQSGQQQYHPQQQQSGQQQQYQQHGQQSGQQYHAQPQQSGQQSQQRGQQTEQYQQHGNQQQPQQRGDQQHGQQRGDQQYSHDANRGQQQYRAGNRPQQWGHAPARRPSFNFRSNDRNTLLRYYGGRLGGINRANRPVFRTGGYLPYEDLGYFSAVPPGAWGSLPPIPYGYEAGYWDGYVVVYDPSTGYILYVSDLL